MHRVSQSSRLCLAVFLLGVAAAGPARAEEAGEHLPEHQTYDLGAFELESGATLPSASLLYVTHGHLDGDRSNAVLLPTAFGSTHHGYDFLIGPGLALDPERYFIVIVELFAGGGSSSPSNTPPPYDGPRFPDVSIRDNVRASYRLLTEHFEIEHLRAVIGFSMGAQQAFQWAVSYPEFMDLIVALCGAAKTYPHGAVRLESVNDIIRADPGYDGGDFDVLTAATKRAWASHWASWLYSQEWWRLELFKPRAETRHEVVESLARAYSDTQLRDQLALARTWLDHDVGDSEGFGGDVEAALQSIQAAVLYIPGETDLYFPVEDAAYESRFIDNLTFKPMPSLWGHLACAGANTEDRAFLNERIGEALGD